MEQRVTILLWTALAVVVLLGLPLDLMEVDAAQYASMSIDMMNSSDWTIITERGRDYLDKPPLLFWASALSYSLFGVHNWSFKLPSVLAAFFGAWALFRLVLLHHPRPVAHTAALMFGGSIAFVLMTNDVRCDTLLTAAVTTAIWQGMVWIEQRRTGALIGFALAVAAGMLAKGPMGLMAPVIALGGQVLFAGRWKALLDPRVLVVPVVIALALLPMCLGLYEQHGERGLRFFFWEQSFGRITGENFWKDDSTVFFFTHELPWMVLPWTVFVLIGLFRSAWDMLRRKALPEYASFTGAVVVFVAVSLSQFKLPHYLYVVLPLFCVMGARAWHAAVPIWAWRAHAALPVVMAVGALVLALWSFPEGGLPWALLVCAAGAGAWWWLRRSPGVETRFAATFLLAMAAAAVLNGHFYPHLLRYQANAQAGKWAHAHGLRQGEFYGLQVGGTALDLYARHHVQWLSDTAEARDVVRPGIAIFTDTLHERLLREAGMVPVERVEMPDYRVQLLGLEMLVPAQRDAVLERRVMLRY
jgi:hypothetical protein